MSGYFPFQGALKAPGLAVKGITTDGSPLYPAPIREVFGPIAHQVCEFHVIAELTKAVLHTVAKLCKTLKARVPPPPPRPPFHPGPETPGPPQEATGAEDHRPL
jgi:hypothetical protein